MTMVPVIIERECKNKVKPDSWSKGIGYDHCNLLSDDGVYGVYKGKEKLYLTDRYRLVNKAGTVIDQFCGGSNTTCFMDELIEKYKQITFVYFPKRSDFNDWLMDEK